MSVTSMTRFQLYRLLRRHNRMAYRRSPIFEQGMVAKVFSILGAGLFVVYLIAIGTSFGLIAAEEGVGILLPLMAFILIVDFLLRFMVQQTPDMLVKPYILLPISKYTVIENFLLSSLFSVYNFLWLALFLPYSVIAIAGGCPWGEVFLILFTCLLLILLNSQFYLLMRSLINRNHLWWLLAAALLALPFAPCLLWDMNRVFDGYGAHATYPLILPLIVALLAGLFWLNRRLQFKYVYEEISKQEKTTLKSVSEFAFLSRFGEVGEYLKLEVKSIMRCKVIRSRCISSLLLIAIFSVLIAYTPIYDGKASTNFWCFYCFALYGVTSLAKVMEPEGNYIDLLLTHRENILQLLRAKYYFHLAILVVPFLIMIPAVLTGKFEWLQMLGYMSMSGGLLYFIMFQLAVYNKQTLLLEQKITGKGNFENGIQLILEMTAFILPMAIVTVLMLCFSHTVAYLLMIALGLLFIVLHPWWLRNIYRRMMARRYENIEGFHTTR